MNVKDSQNSALYELQVFLNLVGLGVDPKYEGFALIYYIMMNYGHFEIVNSGFKPVCEAAAAKFGISRQSVERNIMTVITSAWRTKGKELKELFVGCNENNLPTPYAFISMLLMHRDLTITKKALAKEDLLLLYETLYGTIQRLPGEICHEESV